MSDEKNEKPAKTMPMRPSDTVRISFIRFVADLPVPGDQISHAACIAEPSKTVAGKTYVCTYHPAAGMYELCCYLNGTHSKDLWVPRERVNYHEVMKLDAEATAKRKEPW